MTTIRFATAVLLLGGISIGSATSQVLWYPSNGESSVSLEILKPSFATETRESSRASYGALTGAAFLHGRARLSERLTLVGDLPIAHLAYEHGAGDSHFARTETTIGNPYLGIERRFGRRFVAEAGVRLPFSHLSRSAHVAQANAETTDVDRVEAFKGGLGSVIAAGNFIYEDAGGFRARVRVGPSVALFVPDVRLAYSGQVGYAAQAAEFGIGLTGRKAVTTFFLGEPTVHQLGLAATYTAGRVQPGIHFRIPVERHFRNELNFVVGLNMSVRLS